MEKKFSIREETLNRSDLENVIYQLALHLNKSNTKIDMMISNQLLKKHKILPANIFMLLMFFTVI